MTGALRRFYFNLFDEPRGQLAAIAISAIGALSFQVQPIVLGSFSRTHLLSDQQVGVLASTELTGAFLATLSAVWWLRRINWRLGIGIALASVVLAFLAAGFSGNITALLFVRFLGGLGHGVLYVIAVAYLCDARNTDRLIGFSVAFQLLTAASLYLVLPAIESAAGIQGMLALLALVAALGFLGLPFFPRNSHTPGGQVREDSSSAAWPKFVIIGGMVLFCMSLASIWAYIEIMAQSSGIPTATTGALLAITVPLSALGGITAGIIGLRFGRSLPLLGTALAIVLALSILGTVASTSALFVGFLLQQFFWNLGIAYFYGTVAEFDNDGRLVALAPAAQTLGNALAPVLTGTLLVGSGYLPVNYVSGGCACLAVGLLIFVNRRFRGV